MFSRHILVSFRLNSLSSLVLRLSDHPPLSSIRRSLPKHSDWLAKSSETSLDLNIVGGDGDLSGSLSALKLCQYFSLSLTHTFLHFHVLTWGETNTQSSESVVTDGMVTVKWSNSAFKLTAGDINISSLDPCPNRIFSSKSCSFTAEAFLLLFFKTSIEDPGLFHNWGFVFVRHLFPRLTSRVTNFKTQDNIMFNLQ